MKRITKIIGTISNEIIEKLEGLPNEKIHCAELVIKTLRKAINNLK